MDRCPRRTSAAATSSVPRSTPPHSSAGSICSTVNREGDPLPPKESLLRTVKFRSGVLVPGRPGSQGDQPRFTPVVRSCRRLVTTPGHGNYFL